MKMKSLRVFIVSFVLIVGGMFAFGSAPLAYASAVCTLSDVSVDNATGNVSISGQVRENRPGQDDSQTSIDIYDSSDLNGGASNSCPGGSGCGIGSDSVSASYSKNFNSGTYTAYIDGQSTSNPSAITTTCSNSVNFTVTIPPVVNGACGGSYQVCSAGTLGSSEIVANESRWWCLGTGGGSDQYCTAPIPVNCVGSWNDTSTCSASCGGGVLEEVYTITTPASNGGLSCPYASGETRWGGTSCNTQACVGCSISSFTADNTAPTSGTGTTLRFSLSGSYPWSISLLSGSVLPSPNSGTGSSGTPTTGNLSSSHTYRLTCENSIRDLTVSPAAPAGSAPYISNVAVPVCSNVSYSATFTFNQNGSGPIDWWYLTDHSSMSYSSKYASKSGPVNPFTFPSADIMYYASEVFTLQPNTSYWSKIYSNNGGEGPKTTWNVPSCPNYILTVNSTGTGSGSTTGGGTYAYNTVVPISATASTGSTFSGWTGNADCTDGSVTLDASKTCTANFTLNNYNITFDSAGGSAVSTITQGYGTAVTQPANPTKPGYNFAGWSPAFPANMPLGGLNLTAQWTLASYTLTITPNGGTITGTPITATGLVSYGAGVALDQIPPPGYAFTGWSGGSCSGTGGCNFTMPAGDASVTANYSAIPPPVTLTTGISVRAGNTIDVSWANISASSNPPSTPSSTDWIGLYFSLANSDGTYTDWNYVKSSTGQCTKTATGAISSGTCSFLIPSNASAGSNYHFRLFSNGGYTKLATSNSFTVTELTVSVTATTPYASNISENISFAYTPTTSSGSTECRLLDYRADSNYNLTNWATTNPIIYAAEATTGSYGYYVQCRNVSNTNVIALSNQVIVNVRGTLTVTKAGTGSGTVTSSPVGISCGATCSYIYDYNTAVTLTATPTAGSTFTGWSGACTGTGTCTVTMSQARSVTATFDLGPSVTLTTGSSVQAGSSINVSWANISNSSNPPSTPSSTDWIGLYSSYASSDGTYKDWNYVKSTVVPCTKTATGAASSGTCSFLIPSDSVSGSNYHFRLFSNNGWTKLATSNSFTVNGIPTVTVAVTPSTVVTPNTFRLTMSSTNASSCEWSRIGSYGGWATTTLSSGTSYDSGLLSWGEGNATWSFTCVNSVGVAASNSASLVVNPGIPTVTATVTPSTVQAPNTFRLTMSSTNASSCEWSRIGSYGGWATTTLSSGTSYDSDLLSWGEGNATWSFTCVNSLGQVANTSASLVVTPAAVNGGWSAWSPLTCPTACGLPQSSQTRSCNNPTPAYGGADCVGSTAQVCAATPACNVGPAAPTISGPTTGYPNTSYTYTFTATDPEGDQVRYGIDWKFSNGSTYSSSDTMDGTADDWLPAPVTYVNSGTSRNLDISWSTVGAKKFQALTQDAPGANSAWTNYSVTISSAPVNGSCGTAGFAHPPGRIYEVGDTAYAAGDTYCSDGTVFPTNPVFPSPGGDAVTWVCNGINGGAPSVTCGASVPLATRTVTVYTANMIGGKVVSTNSLGVHDNFIDCGDRCDYNYPLGSTVYLKAYPISSFWKFDSWSGACTSIFSVCTINDVQQPTSVTPVFTPRLFDYLEF